MSFYHSHKITRPDSAMPFLSRIIARNASVWRQRDLAYHLKRDFPLPNFQQRMIGEFDFHKIIMTCVCTIFYAVA